MTNPTPLPCRLGWRRLKIRPTRYGVVFTVLLLGMLVGSINYNNNLGFLLTFLLGGMAIVSVSHTYKNLSGITILSAGTRPVFAGEQAVFEFLLQIPAADRHGVGLTFQSRNTNRHDFAKGSKRRVRVGIPAAARGILRPGPLLIYSDYPCGLFRVQSKLAFELECIIYPRPQIGAVKFMPEKLSGESGDSFNASGNDDFQGLKSYIPGDPLQRISWRASSRGQGLFTKDYTGNYGSALFLDWNTVKGADTERKLSLLCHAVLKAYQLNVVYGLKIPGSFIAPGIGQTHKSRCLRTLALF
jgi:uncharacterized protein (DUF58 family)